VHHVQKREKGTKNEREREREREREFVFYKSLIFSLDSIPNPMVHTIPPLAASTLITNLFFPKMMQFSKTSQRKKKRKLEGKKKKIFLNILEICICII
jgi:hypothetical protein